MALERGLLSNVNGLNAPVEGWLLRLDALQSEVFSITLLAQENLN